MKKRLTWKLFVISLAVFVFISCNSHHNKTQRKSPIEYVKGQKITLSKLSNHPRLFFSKGEETKILRLTKNNSLFKSLIELLKQRADTILSKSSIFQGDTTTNLHKSREAISRIITLSLAYRLFNDKRYANKVEKYLLIISKLHSWHPEHFLDTAELTTAVAIGYDWCYDQLSEKAKKAVAEAIVNKAFAPAWPVYENGDQGSWAKRNTNWNLVCNSGLVTGALAIADRYPQKVKRIIQYAARFTPNEIKNYAPNGVYYEGPAYWNYATMYLVLLLDNFQRNLGTDFGLSVMQGVRKTAKYYINTLSPTNHVFNFADSHATKATLEPIYFYFSRKFNQPEVAAFYRSYLKETLNTESEQQVLHHLPRFFFLSIPWFDDTSYSGSLNQSKLQVFEGKPDLLVFNGDKGNKGELFLIAKGGDPATAHNQMDIGSFVVGSQGIRWGIDIGAEKYSLPNFWNYSPGTDGTRWAYFRNTNLAHNTINIDGKIMYSLCHGNLARFNDSNKKPYGIFNVNSCFKVRSDSVLIGFRMLSPNMMMAQYYVKLNPKAHYVNWRFFTRANITIKKNIVELQQKGKRFYLKILSQGNVRIQENKNVQPYISKARPIKGVKMIGASVSPQRNNWISFSILMGKNISKLRNISIDDILLIAKW